MRVVTLRNLPYLPMPNNSLYIKNQIVSMMREHNIVSYIKKRFRDLVAASYFYHLCHGHLSKFHLELETKRSHDNIIPRTCVGALGEGFRTVLPFAPPLSICEEGKEARTGRNALLITIGQ